MVEGGTGSPVVCLRGMLEAGFPGSAAGLTAEAASDLSRRRGGPGRQSFVDGQPASRLPCRHGHSPALPLSLKGTLCFVSVMISSRPLISAGGMRESQLARRSIDHRVCRLAKPRRAHPRPCCSPRPPAPAQAGARLSVADDGLDRGGDGVQLRPPLPAGSHAGDGAPAVLLAGGEELLA